MVAFIAVLAAVAIAALVYAFAGRGATAQATLDHRLNRASGKHREVHQVDTGPALRGSRFARSASVARTLEDVGSLRRLSVLLERSGWRLSVVEFLALMASCAIAGALVALVRMPILVLPAGLVGALLPYLMLRRAVSKRRDRFGKQLIDALTMIANALKAGVGLLQALDQTAGQLKPPISDEFKRTLRDIRLGATPDDAFQALNERIGSQDLDIVLTAVIVQRSTGGNLAEILENVGATMRDRARIRGEIKTLTTQQQMSGYLVGGMPAALLFLFNLMNHHYVEPLFTTSAGHAMLAAGGTLQVVGFLIIRKIVNIEV